MTTKSSQKGIEVLFASGSIARLLVAFTAEPNRGFYQRELQRITGAHLRQLQRDLVRLERSGFVERRAHGNRVYYQAVAGHPAFPELRGLMAKTLGVGESLRIALLPLGERIELAFVFGSVARGDDVAGSDVDLFVVGSVGRKELSVALASAAVSLGRELNPVIVPRDEFAARVRDRDHFVTSVLDGPRMWLVGDDDALAALG
jgi:predicted nucleotidyltransferase